MLQELELQDAVLGVEEEEVQFGLMDLQDMLVLLEVLVSLKLLSLY
jgi:hypothetical protein